MGDSPRTLLALFEKFRAPLLKRILRIVVWISGAILILVMIGYVVIPVMVPWYIFRSEPDVYRLISRIPRVYTSVPTPPPDWRRIALGNVSLSIPSSELTQINKIPDSFILSMKFRKWIFICSDQTMNMNRHEVSFHHFESIAMAGPNEISFFRLPWKNWESNTNLGLKMVLGEMEMDIFRLGNIKGSIVHKSRSTSDYYSFDVFSKADRIFFNYSIISKNRMTPDEALQILGGIEIINDGFDEAKYKADVQARYKELLEIARRNTSAGNSLAP